MGSKTDLITEALERFKLVVDAESAQRKREQEDLEFQVPENQWPNDVRLTRNSQTVAGVPLPARPMLSFPTLDQPVQLVLNQERAAKLGIEVHPLSEEATDDTAEILQGLYRRIEVDSRAGLARTWAYDRAVKAGRGAYRVLTEYAEDEGGHPSDQRIVIKRLLYQGCAYFDPHAHEADWSDGEWAFIVEDMPLSKFKRRFPDSTVASYSDEEFVSMGSEHPTWTNGEKQARTVRVAEYFRKVYETQTHGPDGDWPGRDYEQCKVMWSIINAVEELTTPKEWLGKYIPLVPVIGRELQPVDGKRIWVGIIGPNKDAARTVNYSASGMVEAAALEPRAPFDIDPEEIEGFESWWQQANTRNFPYLPRKKVLHGQPTGPLQRIQADMSKVGINAALLQMALDQTQRGTGAFDPTLGRSSSTGDSGKKVLALQQQHDQGSGDFLDNLAELSMTLEAKIVLDLIPKVYDRPGRVARILGIEDKPKSVMLNQPFRTDPQTGKPVAVIDQPMGGPPPPGLGPGGTSPGMMPGGGPPPMGPPIGGPPPPGMPPMPGAMPGAMPMGGPPPMPPVYGNGNGHGNPQQIQTASGVKYYDLTKGRYGVTVSVNKRFESRLEQGSAELGALLEAAPALIPILGPTYFKFRDGPGMREAAEILEKMRDNQFPFLKEEDAQPDPAQEAASLKQENAMLKKTLEEASRAVATKQIEGESKFKIAAMQEEAETKRNAEDNAVALQIESMKLGLERMAIQMAQQTEQMAQMFERDQAQMEQNMAQQQAAMDAAYADRGAQREQQMAEGDRAQDMETRSSAMQHERSMAELQHGQAMEQAEQQAALQPPPEPGL